MKTRKMACSLDKLLLKLTSQELFCLPYWTTFPPLFYLVPVANPSHNWVLRHAGMIGTSTSPHELWDCTFVVPCYTQFFGKQIISNFTHFKQGFKADNMKTWKMHWDRQLYKALEHQYQMGLEALNENLPEIKVELVFRYSCYRIWWFTSRNLSITDSIHGPLYMYKSTDWFNSALI